MGKKLFVGNLNFKTNDDDLRTLFAGAGTPCLGDGDDGSRDRPLAGASASSR